MITIKDKQRIRRGFNAAMLTYDFAADWQKNVGERLLEHLDDIQPNQKIILDLGAGTGFLTQHILQRHPNNHLIALDIAENMLRFSKQSTHQNNNNNSLLVCADAERLALRQHSIDMVISNMMLHWCPSLTNALHEQYYTLRPQGLLMFSILGSQSLTTLKNAWRGIDDHTHLNAFPDQATIKNACDKAGFTTLHFERYEIKKHYKTIDEFIHHLKAIGATNISSNKPRGLMSKRKLVQLKKRFQNVISYEIFMVICEK